MLYMLTGAKKLLVRAVCLRESSAIESQINKRNPASDLSALLHEYLEHYEAFEELAWSRK